MQQHVLARDQHQRAAALDGETDHKQRDQQQVEHSAGVAQAEGDQQERREEKEQQRIPVVHEDEQGRDHGDGEHQQGVGHASWMKDAEEVRTLQDDDERRKDRHAEHVTQVPGSPHLPERAGIDEEQCPEGAEKAR